MYVYLYCAFSHLPTSSLPSRSHPRLCVSDLQCNLLQTHNWGHMQVSQRLLLHQSRDNGLDIPTCINAFVLTKIVPHDVFHPDSKTVDCKISSRCRSIISTSNEKLQAYIAIAYIIGVDLEGNCCYNLLVWEILDYYNCFIILACHGKWYSLHCHRLPQ